ncbi:winged helix-turn-helix domain-containing protein [Phytohabitans aurantiacus]|uniref:HTH marR-type domain-containing protein n=1 Tax=Phytohabitans aurantiacus TaxID=3016789 RepID=A0ABQ5R1S9_9ACTN|nr:winged helix-turn-helix domain-containing protein [Phytohabitans aurantiacus]GLI00691.1 hypothetical protein Pa4123_59670 [Phytohabitans aurantiacus]
MDTKAAKPDPIEVVAQALRDSDLTAAAIAKKTGMGYSTVTPKLRALEDAGRAARVKDNGRTVWRLTTPPAQESAVNASPAPESGDTAGTHDAARTTTTTEPPPTSEATPVITEADTSDPDQSAGTDVTPPNPATAAGDANNTQATPTDTTVANQAPDPQQQLGPTTGTASDQADGDATPAEQPTPDTTTPTAPADSKTRRPPGALARTALRIMQTNPDTPYKVTDLGRLIDQTDNADGHTYPKASPGAVVLACDRLVDGGNATKVLEKPATYQLAATQPANP